MSVIKSQIDPHSQEFKANADHMQKGVDEFRSIEQSVINAAESKKQRYQERGFLSPRERLNLLLDPGAPFLEMWTLVGYMQDEDTDGSYAGGTCIGGIGYIAGVRCIIYADDFLTKGGTMTRLSGGKRLRIQRMALLQKLPLVVLAQSGGGNLRYAGDVYGTSGELYANQARLSAAGIPQITVVHGSATAGGAYQPGMSDYVIMVRKQSAVYLAGPPLLKAATGEIATDEEIGGAELHSSVSGLCDYLAENDADGIRIAREIMAKLHWNMTLHQTGKKQYKSPLYAPEELLGVVPIDPKMPYDVREIIARIADGSDFLDFKPEYDSGTVCGYIELHGHACGIMGNNSPITANGAAKSAQFMQLCDQAGMPIVFLHNTTGFLVGTEQERSGVNKHGSKMIQAVTNIKVPKISVVVGGSYGAGNFAMCGRGMDPDFMFAWPHSVVSVMGPAQAGSVMRQVAEAQMKKRGQVDEAKLDQIAETVQTDMEARSHALANSARLWDDGLIDPRDTRTILAFVLDICREAGIRKVNANSFGIGRM